MGYYIETSGNFNKAREICEANEATIIPRPRTYADIPKGKGLICVVSNGAFEAAGFCFNEKEFEAFTSPDGRPRTWVLMRRDEAEKQSGYKEQK